MELSELYLDVELVIFLNSGRFCHQWNKVRQTQAFTLFIFPKKVRNATFSHQIIKFVYIVVE